MKRIDSYRAYCSSAYLWLSSHDPVLLAFELSRELSKCIQSEQQYKVCEMLLHNWNIEPYGPMLPYRTTM